MDWKKVNCFYLFFKVVFYLKYTYILWMEIWRIFFKNDVLDYLSNTTFEGWKCVPLGVYLLQFLSLLSIYIFIIFVWGVYVTWIGISPLLKSTVSLWLWNQANRIKELFFLSVFVTLFLEVFLRRINQECLLNGLLTFLRP